MFVDEDNLRRFLANLKRLTADEGGHRELRNYFWFSLKHKYPSKNGLYALCRFVASDSWGMKGSVVKGFEHIVNGAITVAPKVRFLKGELLMH